MIELKIVNGFKNGGFLGMSFQRSRSTIKKPKPSWGISQHQSSPNPLLSRKTDPAVTQTNQNNPSGANFDFSTLNILPPNSSQTTPLQKSPAPTTFGEMVLQRQALQRQSKNPENSHTPTVQAEFEQNLESSKGGGTPLDQPLRAKLEPRMGADFSGVKVHTDSNADQLNQSIQAKAFTTGQDIFFRQGEYNPNSQEGQKLIAHELTHTMQQNPATIQRKQNGGALAKAGSTDDIKKLMIIQDIAERVKMIRGNGLQSSLGLYGITEKGRQSLAETNDFPSAYFKEWLLKLGNFDSSIKTLGKEVVKGFVKPKKGQKQQGIKTGLWTRANLHQAKKSFNNAVSRMRWGETKVVGQDENRRDIKKYSPMRKFGIFLNSTLGQYGKMSLKAGSKEYAIMIRSSSSYQELMVAYDQCREQMEGNLASQMKQVSPEGIIDYYATAIAMDAMSAMQNLSELEVDEELMKD